jgi:hypothetical protein
MADFEQESSNHIVESSVSSKVRRTKTVFRNRTSVPNKDKQENWRFQIYKENGIMIMSVMRSLPREKYIIS